MVISNEDIISFQELYKKHFGKEINKEEAYEKGIKLLSLISAIYHPMTEDELKTIQERQKLIPEL